MHLTVVTSNYTHHGYFTTYLYTSNSTVSQNYDILVEDYGFRGGKKKIADMAAMSLKLAARLKLSCEVLLN